MDDPSDGAGGSRIMSRPGSAGALHPAVGTTLLVASSLGYPLTQVAIASLGRRGALAAEAVSAGLLVRDLVLVANGAPARLRPVPAALLGLEVAAAASATLLGAAAIVDPRGRPCRSGAGLVQALRRAAVGTLFGVHTYRFWLYLQPDRGLRRHPEP
jgi:hypothetical protein